MVNILETDIGSFINGGFMDTPYSLLLKKSQALLLKAERRWQYMQTSLLPPYWRIFYAVQK